MSKLITKFKNFQEQKETTMNEAVVEVGDVLKLSNIEIKKSVVKKYMSRVKDETGKEVMQSMADVAEDMVKYSLENGVAIDEVPVHVLTGGDDELDAEMPDDSIEIDTESELEGEGDLDLEEDEGDLPTGTDESEEGPEETSFDEFEETEGEEAEEGMSENLPLY